MGEIDFISILNEIKNEEYTYRDIEKIKQENGQVFYTGPDIIKPTYDYTLAFFIYIKFKSIVDLCSVEQEKDIEQILKDSNHIKATKALAIWNELKYQYPYFNKLLALLNKYDFSSFQNEENEKILGEWGTKKLLKDGLGFNGDLNIVTSYNIIYNCQKHLGIDMNSGDLLIMMDDQHVVYNVLFHNNSQNANYYLYNCSLSVIPIIINAYLLDCYSNIHVLEELPERQFDGVLAYKWKKEDNVSCGECESLLVDGGFCMVLGQELSNLPDVFNKYEIPLLFETDKFNILLRKVEDKTQIVRYGWFFVESMYFEDTQLVNDFTECIKNNLNKQSFQILKKEDFRNTGKIHFQDVKRLPDQIDFVWRRLDDVISIKEDNKWLWDYNVPDDKIVNWQSLSDNPYQINIPEEMYLTKDIYVPSNDEHILQDCEIIREGMVVKNYKIPEKYGAIFDKCYSSDKEMDDTCRAFDKLLCCRVLTHPSLLYDCGRILRVKASPEKPVCFRSIVFSFEEDYMGIMCAPQMDEIEIDSQYDENFIIYQLLKRKDSFSDYLLVAPTKEEQHTYFLNKRLDYLAKYKPVVDEMEHEVQNSILESPTYITGVGFKNFHRFAELPVMSLSGVNIFVGGNNAGKSTLVKGLLLTLDNIKNLVIDYGDNTLINPKFKYDANNYHDVHVGTFDRAYSANPIIDSEVPNRRFMSFSLSFAHFTIELVVVPVSQDDTTSVPIASITVNDKKRDAVFCFDFENMRTIAKFSIGGELVDYSFSGIRFNSIKVGGNHIPALIRGIIPDGNSKSALFDDKAEKLRGKYGFMLEIADELERIISNANIEYIYAHGVNQKVLFNYNDKNDYMAQTLHDLVNEKIGDVEHDFICKWLEEFGLGVDYDVHSIGGEAYIIQIKTSGGKMVYLADMGMGSNQLVILILRLAIIIHRHRMNGNKVYRPTIVIEEPEQNMHPAFQSKLAILFNDVHKDYGFNFIVETHSEYLVRRSQVIVAQQKYTDEEKLRDECPFKVYYFPSDGTPYEMLYRTDGNFSNEFGNGFYDEANNLLFEII